MATGYCRSTVNNIIVLLTLCNLAAGVRGANDALLQHPGGLAEDHQVPAPHPPLLPRPRPRPPHPRDPRRGAARHGGAGQRQPAGHTCRTHANTKCLCRKVDEFSMADVQSFLISLQQQQ